MSVEPIFFNMPYLMFYIVLLIYDYTYIQGPAKRPPVFGEGAV
jgi:hypothetical protein